MHFLNPGVLSWLWLALVPLALYLFRRKSRTVRVSTLLFYKSLAREHQESAWLRRLKRWVSLLLSLLLVCGPVVALARLIFAPMATQARSVVVVVDTSASMAAVDGTGETRLDRARALIRQRLAGVPESVPVAVVTSGAVPEVVHPKSTNRRDLLRVVDGLTVRPTADKPMMAWASAAAIAALETPGELWWVSDFVPGTEAVVPTGVVRRDFNLALDQPVNAGITAFAVTRVPLVHGRYQVYVQVALNAGAPSDRTVVVEPKVAGVPVARRELMLQPGSAEGLTLEIEATQEQVIEVSLELAGDVMASDDAVVARLPAPRPLVVAWFTPKPDPFTGLALQALASEGEVEVFTGGPAQWPPPTLPDVVIFDSWLPDPWPANLPAVVINPPGSAGPVRARALNPGVPRDEVRSVADDHPVMFRLNPGRLALTQTSVLDATGVLQPIWLAGDQPVLAAGESGGQRLVVLACAPGQSEQFPLTTTYPLLLGNALYWCAEPSLAARHPNVQPSGTLVEGITSPIEWRELREGRLLPPSAVPAPPNAIAVLDRLGLWRTTDGSREGATALLSRQETNLNISAASAVAPPGESPVAGSDPSKPPAVADPGSVAAVATAHATTVAPREDDGGFFFGGELTRWVIGLVLAALLLESWLYHRHAVN